MADNYIEGLEGLLKDMEVLPRTIQRKIIAKSLREGAEPIQDQMIKNAPDDPTTPGSQIAENISLNVTEQTSEHSLAFIGPTKKGFMGGFHEFGTAHQTARPFMGPAFDEKVAEASAIISYVLGHAIEKELKK